MKHYAKVLLAVLLTLAILVGCGTKETEKQKTGEVTIIYTNDVHTYINNTTENEDGETVDRLTYGKVAALKQDLEAEGLNVLLVDAGDHAQGTAFGGMDEGKSIMAIMNAAGYQLATLGNHEFDYGQFRAFAIMDEADFPYVSCNFYNVADDSLVLPAYEILEVGGVKVAFIGISTPETITKTTPAYFQDENGNYIYNFKAGEDGQDLYDAVQAAIDEIGDNADYIIALGHLGVDESSRPYTSREVIANTTGLDAFIDGHSHTTIAYEEVADKNGNVVVLTQTGSYLREIGKMTIVDGAITTELITEYDNTVEAVDALADEWANSVNSILGEKIAANDIDLYINEVETGKRIVRCKETNLGDLFADGVYYYFNEVEGLDCDMAIANGGGVRADVPAGDFSYNTAKTVAPFGNVICMVEVTGQQILDMLEWGAQNAGLVGEDGNYLESGGFLQVAGITYVINSEVESTVVKAEDGTWSAGPTGEYKVSDVKVYNRETGEYDDLVLDEMYTVAGVNYTLRNGGDGYLMLKDCTLVKDYVGEDYLIFSEYVKAFAQGDDGYAHISTENSPLATYEGYLIDYENPTGAGRIVVK